MNKDVYSRVQSEAYPSSHLERGRVHPGRVAEFYQVVITFNRVGQYSIAKQTKKINIKKNQRK